MKPSALLAAAFAIMPSAADSGTVTVAIAANFTKPANEIAELFKDVTGHEAVLSFGASGTLYAQITQAAPFDVFLSADDELPRRAIAEGHALAGSEFTYAIGRLVLYGADPTLAIGPDTLRADAFAHLAIAKPATAPYGRAAVEAMTALGVYDLVAPSIVEAQNVTQAFQFVATGNAELGFVALAQTIDQDAGSYWLVPEDLYAPIRQDGILLVHGAENPAATAFMEFLRGPEAAAVIGRYGYGATD